MSNYNLNPFRFFIGRFPSRIVPRFLLRRFFYPPVPANGNGTAKCAPYGMRKIEAEINALPQVTRFYRLLGRYSGLLEVLTKDQEELTTLVKEIHELEGMRETETFIVHSSVKDKPYDVLLDAIKDR